MSTDAIRLAVVVNAAGAGEVADALADELAGRGVESVWLETTAEDPGAGQAAQAVRDGVDVVVVCGGDGTVRAALDALSGTGAALAVVPAGTGNLLARNLGVPTGDPLGAVEVALGRGRRTIDVGYANDEAFAVMAGAGFDATVMKQTPRESKDRFGSLAYVRTALAHLRDPHARCTLTVDGERVFDGRVATVLAANHGALQGGLDLFPDSAADDGLLDLMAVSARSAGQWLRSAVGVAAGRDVPDLVQRWCGTDAVVELRQPTAWEIDGDERPPTTRLAFRVARRSLTVCVPEDLP